MFDRHAIPSQVSAPARVFLARHGETTWNVERRFQGQQDSPLTERGQEQARRLGQRLASEPLAAVYSSDLGRTLRTAEQVALPHALGVRTHPGLREIDTGAWTGLGRTEVRALPEWSASMDIYRNRPWEHRMPQGEAVAEVQARALEALREIAPQHAGQTIAVISHHLVVETIIAYALGHSLEELWLPYRGGNCFVSTLEITAENCRAVSVYDGSHVADLAGLDGTKGEQKDGA